MRENGVLLKTIAAITGTKLPILDSFLPAMDHILDSFLPAVERTSGWTGREHPQNDASSAPLLAVTPHDAQLQSIMQVPASVQGKPSGRSVFALHTVIHPTTIATAWRTLTSVTPTGHPTCPTITTEPHILIQ